MTDALKRSYVALESRAAFYSTEDYESLRNRVEAARTHGSPLVETEMLVYDADQEEWQAMPGSFDVTRLLAINAVPIAMAEPLTDQY